MSARISFDQFPLATLCRRLTELGDDAGGLDRWPLAGLAACGDAGVFRWFHGSEQGGWEWPETDVLRGYLALSAACLTTTFVITQRTAACQRIERSDNAALRRRWLPRLVSGELFATVGISHLTTSRQHLAPVMRAERTAGGYLLDGFSPWVTGARHAALIVTGATLADGDQLLVALPTDREGVSIPEPMSLVALSASATGEVHCRRTFVADDEILFGPRPNVMQAGAGGGTGGLQTSTLALGTAHAGIAALRQEGERRPELVRIADAFRRRFDELVAMLESLASGVPSGSTERLRRESNDLALQATQAALAAVKGSGFTAGHPVGRRAIEALFFLVWSCPRGVVDAHLCDWSAADTILPAGD